jgi:MFS family permease
MPVHVFRAPSFTALIFVVLFSYMGIGIVMVYFVSWQQILRDLSVLQTGLNFIPFGVGSVLSVALAAWMIPRLSAQWMLAFGIITCILANVLLATMPIHQTYWAQAFPAIAICSLCPDFVYVAAQVIASNSVGRRYQGVAGSLIGTLNLYGNSLGIGVAATVEMQIAKGHTIPDLFRGYRAALYFGCAIAVASLILNVAFVRMPKDNREGWEETQEHTDEITASSTAVSHAV